jgi:hypothetical protein
MRNRWMWLLPAVCVGGWLLAAEPARHTYWFGPFAECSSVLDINGDGAETNGPDVDYNYEGTMDVDNDGRPDVLSSGRMRRQGSGIGDINGDGRLDKGYPTTARGTNWLPARKSYPSHKAWEAPRKK